MATERIRGSVMTQNTNRIRIVYAQKKIADNYYETLKTRYRDMNLAFLKQTASSDSSGGPRLSNGVATLSAPIPAKEVSTAALPPVDDAGLRKILDEWKLNRSDDPSGAFVHRLIEEQVGRTPDAAAVVFRDQCMTYRELNSAANRLAHYLRKLGVGPEAMIGICVERSLEMLVGLLGILKAGGAYVPLDPTYPRERLEFILEDAGISLLLTQRRLSAGLPLHKAQPLFLDADWATMALESDENPAMLTSRDNAAYVIYTSGSTGKPKGVIIEHGSFANFTRAAASQYGIGPSDRVLQFASMSFDASVEEIYPCLTSGATLVLRTDEMLSSVPDFLGRCQEWKLTVLDLPTAYWHVLCHSLESENMRMPETVRLVIIGGEKAFPERLVTWQRQVGPSVRLLNTYGPTEATVVATVCDLTDLRHDGDSSQELPIGRPLPGIQTYILDSHLQPLPVGLSGELHIGGGNLARGYLNQPDLTAERFISDPYAHSPKARLYKTGDVARCLPGGNIEFLGRIDDQVKIRGFRLELGEIEALLRQYPAVLEAVVLAREDQPGDKRLVAYIMSDGKHAITSLGLRDFMKEKLPPYMLPSTFMMLEALPLTASGKVDRKALPPPDQCDYLSKRIFVAPRNKLERDLTETWEEILAIRPIGVTDNFFDLGGHSLLAMRMTSEINKKTGKRLATMDIFQNPTIEQLAGAIIEESESAAWASLVPVRRNGSRPPFFWIHGQASDALLPRYLDEEQPLYVMLHQGQDGSPVRHRTIEDIAAHYLKEIRSVRPRGPYLLGGYCLGGVVALEMAHQLSGQGEEVPMIFLLELPTEGVPPSSPRESPPQQSGSFKERVVHRFRYIAELRVNEKIPYVFSEIRPLWGRMAGRLIVKYKRKIELAVCRAYEAIGRPLPPALRSFTLMNIYDDALRGYAPRPYRGQLILCQAGETICRDQSYWTGVSDKALDIHIVPDAGHENILQEPHVSIWAHELNRCLRKQREISRHVIAVMSFEWSAFISLIPSFSV